MLKRHLKRKRPCDISYKCQKCQKTFKDNFDLKRHLNRKTPCEPLINNEPPVIKKDEPKCKFCGRKYSSIYTLRRHLKTSCRVKNGGMELLYTAVLKENEQLKKELNQARNSPTVTNITNNVINANITNNIVIVNNYDPENTINYKAESILQMQKKSKGPIPIASAMIKHTYFNPNRPENHSIYFPNVKESKVLTYINKWIVDDLNNVSDDLMVACHNNIRNILLDFARSGVEIDSAPQYVKILSALEKKFDECSTSRRRIDAVGKILRENRSVIAETWRSMGVPKITTGTRAPRLI